LALVFLVCILLLEENVLWYTSSANGLFSQISLTREHTMGRICQMINVNNEKCWTLFDTGARNTYVIPSVALLLTSSKLKKPFRTAIGGAVKESTETALLEAEIEGRRISAHAMVIDEIGKDENGIPIEILFGALAMQQWGIRLIPEQEKLDLTHYPEEFVEF
jgi:hypothetical protein